MDYIIWTILILIIFFLFSGIKIIRPTQRAVIERLGKYNRLCKSGFNFAIPIFERVYRVNVTERMMDVNPQDIITKDNLNAKVDLVVFYKVRDDEENVKKAFYNVNDVSNQIITLAQTTARNVIGNMNFSDVNSKRNELNNQLAKTIDKQTDEWGVQIVRVELKEISPPRDVQETMNRVIKAENLKDAAKDEAEAKETTADGERRASIKIAEGKRQAAILEAEGKAKAFDLIEKSFKGNAQLDKRLEITRDSLKDNAKIVLTEKGINHSIILGDLPMKLKKE